MLHNLGVSFLISKMGIFMLSHFSRVRLLANPMYCSLPGSSVHGILQEKVLECIAIPFSRDLPEPGIEPRSPALQADSLLFEYSFSLLLVDSVFENLSKVYS